MSRPLHPQFAVEARQLLADSRAIDAVRLCSEGIEDYPQYAGGYVMLAKAYAKLGLTDDAEALVRDITLRFPYVHVAFVEEVTTEAPTPAAHSVPTPEEPAAEELTTEEPAAEELTPEEPAAEELTPEEPAAEVAIAPSHVLRMIETAPIADDAPIIRSSSVRLIPGLEFTTLRVEGIRSRGRRGIGSLPEPPSFRQFHSVRRPQRPAEPTPQRKAISLEELASRLVDAKMPRQSDLDAAAARNEPPPPPQPQPILVTETIANIYMQQQSYDLAIEAYKTLMARKPDRREHFEALIRECERKRG